MSLSEKFKEAAEIYPGMIDGICANKMKDKGYFFSQFTWINDGPETPVEDWETLVNELGGDSALDGEFYEDADPAFVVTHKETGKTAGGNGSTSVLADLWLQVNE